AAYPNTISRLRVVPEGVNAAKFSSPVMAVQSSSEPYFLFVSTLFPYKNAARLLHAFAGFCRDKGAATNIRLKLAGKDPDGRQLPMLQRLSNELGISDRVEW